jgi:excisionase family DNA binding protein
MTLSSAMQHELTTTLPEPDVQLAVEQLLTVREVAGLLRVPVSWVYERTRRQGSERLPHVKVGKYVRFRPAEIEAYLETLRRD